ncbi:MAG TPA: VCBS repeat-containing protein, partial [Acidobacteriota bacterium]|nr:VCBS repeat-containing protein [Acidobacteriota bacterium]
MSISRSTTVWLASLLIIGSLLPRPAHAASSTNAADSPPPVTFVDVAEEAGLIHENVWGGVERKTYIIEAKGSGLGFLDYNNDGWLDIFTTNGVRFGEQYSEGQAPTSHLYRNNQNGTFLDVAREAGVARTGWQTGVCVGDFDNDGWDDLFAADWGHNTLFRNKGDGT